jgi:hypothetical protein
MRPKVIKIRTRDLYFQHIEVLLRNREKRTRYKEFVVEGVRSINAAIDYNWQISSFIYSQGHPLSAWANDILGSSKADVHLELVPELMAEISGKEETSELKPVRPISQEVKPPQETKAATLKAKQAIGALEDRIAASEREAQDLRKQLSEAKSSLAAAELEISRLSSIIQESSRARLNIGEPVKLSRSSDARVSEAKAKTVEVRPVSAAPASSLATGQDLNSDVQVATIAVDKADLRLGPGRNHSPLMSLRRGSRLAIEARQGEWYRVFAPNGQRAWIHSSLVRFGDGAASLNDGSSVKVRGYDSKIRQ